MFSNLRFVGYLIIYVYDNDRLSKAGQIFFLTRHHSVNYIFLIELKVEINFYYIIILFVSLFSVKK